MGITFFTSTVCKLGAATALFVMLQSQSPVTTEAAQTAHHGTNKYVPTSVGWFYLFPLTLSNHRVEQDDGENMFKCLLLVGEV